jgi:hypothetical protein
MKLPENRQSYFCAGGMAFVQQFLEQYYNLYDGDNREAVAVAYHNDVNFSITSNYPPAQSSTTSPK